VKPTEAAVKVEEVKPTEAAVKVEEVIQDGHKTKEEPQKKEEPKPTEGAENIKIDDEEDDDEMPDLESTSAADEASGGAGKGKPTRSEKKSRKAVSKLGMKPVDKVLRITVKKGKNVLFVINNPDVYKSPNNDSTWVVFGEAKIEDTDEALKKTAESFAVPDKGDEVPELVETKAAEETPTPTVSPSAPTVVGTPTPAPTAPTPVVAPVATPAAVPDTAGADDLEGVNPKHIELVMEQAKGTTRAQAIKALKASGGDIVNAIMEITMGGSGS